MEYEGDEVRRQVRTYIEPYDTGTFLTFTLDEKMYRFTMLDTSPGGMGMLVSDEDREVLQKLTLGERITMEYTTPEGGVMMNFEIRHITPIESGKLSGNIQIGLALYSGIE